MLLHNQHVLIIIITVGISENAILVAKLICYLIFLKTNTNRTMHSEILKNY